MNLDRSIASFAIAFAMTALGCNQCEKMTNQICVELGDDCELWKEIGGPEEAVPGGRGVNRACGNIMDNELAWEGTLNSHRGRVYAEQLKRAVAKKDQAGIDAAKKKLEENKQRIEEGIAKLKK
jgi:hypothetical protein